MTTLDLPWIRAQFPALAEQVAGRPAIFFDGPGGTQVPQQVIDAIVDYLTRANANIHNASITSQRTDEIITAARQAMADFLGCDADEVSFGWNMTTLTFAFSRAFGRTIQPGDEIVLTRLDHDANVAPWRALEELGAVIRYADVDVEDCTLDMDDLASKIGPRTRLVAVGLASNAVGTINDVRRVAELAHAVGALCFVDAVHYGPHGPIDVRELGCDLLACSPYKFFAPHLGTLYGRRDLMESLTPYKVRPATDANPDRWETGTKSHENIAGVVAAINYLADLGRHHSDAPFATRREAIVHAMQLIQQYERGLGEQMIAGLLAIPGLSFYGISDPSRFGERTPTVAVRIEGKSPRQLAEALAERGVFCTDGNYYALNLTERLGLEEHGGMLRIGLVHYNTPEEVDFMLATLRAVAAA